MERLWLARQYLLDQERRYKEYLESRCAQGLPSKHKPNSKEEAQ